VIMQYLSQEGYRQHKKELEETKFMRQEVAKRLEEAKALGDLSENQEYISAKEAQAFNEGRILELEQLLREAVVIDKNNRGNSMVQVGCSVEIKGNGKERVFTIVGSEEAAPASGKISNESPLGKAFLGRKIGEVVEVETPGGKVKYKITAIN